MSDSPDDNPRMDWRIVASVIAVLFLVLASVAFVWLTADDGGDNQQAEAPPSATGDVDGPTQPQVTTQPTEQSPTTTPEEGAAPDNPPTGKARTNIVKTVKTFTKAWLSSGSPKERKQALLKVATPTTADMIAHIAPANLPNTKPTGKVTNLSGSQSGTVSAIVPLKNGTKMYATMAYEPGAKYEWRVTRWLDAADVNQEQNADAGR